MVERQPPTSATIMLETNYGTIEVDLWANEAPESCKNFIQLCLEGFFDRKLFTRIIRQ